MVAGDVNGDDVVNVADILLMLNFHAQQFLAVTCRCPSYCRADVNQDLVADVRDLLGVLSRYGSVC